MLASAASVQGIAESDGDNSDKEQEDSVENGDENVEKVKHDILNLHKASCFICLSILEKQQLYSVLHIFVFQDLPTTNNSVKLKIGIC